MPLVYLERLARCPGTEDRQGTADLAALETPEGVASLPSPLHFWAEETERSARWRPLCPRTLAGLADWSPEGTEERRAPCNAVYTALPQRGRPSRPWTIGIRAFWPKTIDPQIRLRPGRVTLTPILASTRSDIPRIRSWNTIGAAPPSSPSWPPQPPWRKRGKHCALTWEVSQEALVCHIQYIIVYISLQYIYIYIYIYKYISNFHSRIKCIVNYSKLNAVKHPDKYNHQYLIRQIIINSPFSESCLTLMFGRSSANTHRHVIVEHSIIIMLNKRVKWYSVLNSEILL